MHRFLTTTLALLLVLASGYGIWYGPTEHEVTFPTPRAADGSLRWERDRARGR